MTLELGTDYILYGKKYNVVTLSPPVQEWFGLALEKDIIVFRKHRYR